MIAPENYNSIEESQLKNENAETLISHTDVSEDGQYAEPETNNFPSSSTDCSINSESFLSSLNDTPKITSPPEDAQNSTEGCNTKKEQDIRSKENFTPLKAGVNINEYEIMDYASKSLEYELKESKKRGSQITQELIDNANSKQQLKIVMKEYDRIISQLVAEKEEEEKERERQKSAIINEIKSTMNHLQNTELAFKDVKDKFTQNKNVIENLKANEDLLKIQLATFDQVLKTNTEKYECLKNHTTDQLEAANKERDLLQRSHLAETSKLRAMLKKVEVKIVSLEEGLQQKSKDNKELADICDELINKIGITKQTDDPKIQ